MTTVTTADVPRLQRELDDRGFVVVPGVVSPDALTEFGEYIVGVFERAPKFKGGGMMSGHLNCYPGARARFVYDELVACGIVDAVHQIRAGRPNQVRATMNFNMPGSVAQHYHMDGAYLDDFLVCNIAVVDTDLANGAMDVLPGTQREFLPFWRYAVSRTYRLSTRLPMKRGDILLRKSNLWHRGMPNRTQVARPLLSITFGEKGAPDGDPFTMNGGEVEFYANWYSTSRAGQIRERVTKAAPWTYSAYRFVSSLRGNRGYASY